MKSPKNQKATKNPGAGKVCVVWLDNGEVTSDFAVSISDIFRAQSHVINGRVIVRSGGAITRGRNSSISTFLSSCDDEWALLVDSDMSFPVEAFTTVLNAADATTRPVVGGLCFAHSGQYAGPFQTLIPTIYHSTGEGAYRPMWDYPDNEMVECDATGAAFLLVHRSVLLDVREKVGLGEWSWFHEGPSGDLSTWMGEDVIFCEIIKAAGYPIFVHTGAKIGHVKGTNYTLDEPMYKMLHQAVTHVDA